MPPLYYYPFMEEMQAPPGPRGYTMRMKREWQRTLLAGLACLLLGYAHGSSRLDRLAVSVRDFVAIYEKSADLEGMSVNDRIRFRALKRELDRLARETGP